MSDFNPDMLVLARESRQMTQAQVARASGITQGKVSKYEGGLLGISDKDINIIASVLSYPESFFTQREVVHGFGSPCFSHRKKKSVPMSILRTIHARINIFRIAASRLLRGADIETANEFPRLDIEEFDGRAEEVARRLRAIWNMPLGPVKNVIAAIEAAGGVVVGFPFGTAKIDAVSQLLPELPPVFFINTDIESGDRLRFTLSHELGHVIMRNAASLDPEREADRFAREFLMPAREIGRDLARMNIGKAARLKPYWKTSMQSIIGRAYELNAISKTVYQSLFSEISRLGYRLREPIPIAPEKPTIMPEIFNIYENECRYNDYEFVKLLCIYEPDYRPFRPSTGHDGVNLRLVQ